MVIDGMDPEFVSDVLDAELAVMQERHAEGRAMLEQAGLYAPTLGVLGAAGAVYFGWMIYKEGLQLTRVGYLVICSLMLLVAFARSGKRPDDTLKKYRRYYLGRRATFKIDEAALAKADVTVEDITARTIPEDFSRNPRIHRCYLVRRTPRGQ